MAGAPSGAWDRPLLTVSMTVSGNDLSAASDQYVFVKCGSANNDVVPAASGDCPEGVSYGTGKDGSAIDVVMSGIVKLRLAGTVYSNTPLKPTSGTNDGRAVASTNIGAIGARAMMGGSSGDVITALLTQGYGS